MYEGETLKAKKLSTDSAEARGERKGSKENHSPIPGRGPEKKLKKRKEGVPDSWGGTKGKENNPIPLPR